MMSLVPPGGARIRSRSLRSLSARRNLERFARRTDLVERGVDVAPAAPKRVHRVLQGAVDAREDGSIAGDQQWRNWTKPFLTEPDIRQELKLLISSTKAPGLQQLDPVSALVGPL